MKTIRTTRTVEIPDGVTVTVKSRTVSVQGPRGKLSRSFQHVNLSLRRISSKKLLAEMWFGNRKQIATIRSVTSHIENMITGVTKGFQYKMRLVYSHFPINVSLEDGGKELSIRNFLGEKVVRTVPLEEGVSCVRSTDIKDQLVLTGNNIDAVGQSAARIHQSCLVKNKDIRKFLDGIYVSQSGLATDE
ncbi:Large ribosomal subunit protein uL6 alpha-beta domain-containing protein [Plasmodiophora brassicae]|uniref:Large ribosomal subunit protein uL6 alpha-beta domain-containing protein n=1 Tax=Plasmodiophora brassicae TaxID=37360 RepID=A0A0G4ITZ1_PLABS|nr:hypothetical protein PBRA_006844 [Plasmodiophora brassicae]SPR00870.1 unnamed protein product [Plasmodiophora brassicae]